MIFMLACEYIVFLDSFNVYEFGTETKWICFIISMYKTFYQRNRTNVMCKCSDAS